MSEYGVGIYDISNEDYHNAEGVCRSQLMSISKSPMHFEYYKKEPKVETESMLIGSAVHALLLEPETYDLRYVVSPVFNKRTKAGKEMLAEFSEKHAGKSVLTIAQSETVNAMVTRLRENEYVEPIITKAKYVEKSIFFKHDRTQLLCKSRTDFVAGKIAVDLKTTKDASEIAFQRSAIQRGYYLQAAMTQAALQSVGIEIKRSLIIAIENTPPYAIGIYKFDDLAIEFGKSQFDDYMGSYWLALQAQKFEDYGVRELLAPRWAMTTN